MTDESEFSLHIDESTNRTGIHCQYCNSIMLKPRAAFYVENEVSVHVSHQIHTINFRRSYTPSQHFSFVTVQFTNDAPKEKTKSNPTTNPRTWNGKSEKFLESSGHVYVWEHWIFEHCRNSKVFDMCRLWDGSSWLLWY